MQVKTVVLKNFRCFPELELTFDGSVVVIRGDNGSGKTTLLEALHYLCYLRSFRTYSPKELIQFNKSHFFVRAHYEAGSSELHTIQAGCIGTKRLVKIDNRSVYSFKELMDYYRVITLTEDDVNFIKGGPDIRRFFMDQALILHDHEFIEKIKVFRSILDNRNMLLKSNKQDKASYDIWTTQLKEISDIIRRRRKNFLGDLSKRVNNLIATYFEGDMTITITYKSKEIVEDLQIQEYRLGRSLFGAHLDDFLIQFKHKQSKAFASRGQQKLIIALLKIAQIQLLSENKGASLFLVDDFLTDFDELRIERLLAAMISLPGQKIFTCPTQHIKFSQLLAPLHHSQINLPT